jgi:uncharacterized protein (DUF2062 family)
MGKLGQRLQILLGIEDTPHRVALSFAIGVCLAWFPIYGSHTVLALLFAHLCRVSRAPALLGIWVNNPWTIVPMYMAGTLLGCAMMGISPEDLWAIDWHVAVHSFHGMFDALRPYLWPFLVGNTVLGVLAGVVSYFGLRAFLERRRRTAAAPMA